MPRCPNCFYELVLLEHRRKYKCAKCGKLFGQQEVDSKEFTEWNKRRRRKAKKKSTEEAEEAWSEYRREWAIQNKDKIKIYSKRAYEKRKKQGII